MNSSQTLQIPEFKPDYCTDLKLGFLYLSDIQKVIEEYNGINAEWKANIKYIIAKLICLHSSVSDLDPCFERFFALLKKCHEKYDYLRKEVDDYNKIRSNDLVIDDEYMIKLSKRITQMLRDLYGKKNICASMLDSIPTSKWVHQSVVTLLAKYEPVNGSDEEKAIWTILKTFADNSYSLLNSFLSKLNPNGRYNKYIKELIDYVTLERDCFILFDEVRLVNVYIPPAQTQNNATNENDSVESSTPVIGM